MPQRTYLKPEYNLFAMPVIAMFLLLFAAKVAAEHEADHRYEIRGYVLDAQENPRSNSPVTVVMGDQTIGSARTDSEGYYSVRLHLHDSDIGKSLLVRAGNAQTDIRMEATRGDRTTRRLHHVNFVGGQAIEEKLSAGGVPTWAYIAAAPVVLWGVVYVSGATRRKIRRTKSARRKEKSKGKR